MPKVQEIVVSAWSAISSRNKIFDRFSGRDKIVKFFEKTLAAFTYLPNAPAGISGLASAASTARTIYGIPNGAAALLSIPGNIGKIQEVVKNAKGWPSKIVVLDIASQSLKTVSGAIVFVGFGILRPIGFAEKFFTISDNARVLGGKFPLVMCINNCIGVVSTTADLASATLKYKASVSHFQGKLKFTAEELADTCLKSVISYGDKGCEIASFIVTRAQIRNAGPVSAILNVISATFGLLSEIIEVGVVVRKEAKDKDDLDAYKALLNSV